MNKLKYSLLLWIAIYGFGIYLTYGTPYWTDPDPDTHLYCPRC